MSNITTTTPGALTPQQADKLDSRIRKVVAEIGTRLETLDSLITEAIQTELHKHLGYRNIQAYLQDVFRVEGVKRDIEGRRQVVQLLSQKQLSQRAIADIVGVDKRTILRDQEQVGHTAPAEGTEEPAVTVGRDGKKYTRKPKAPKAKPEPEIIDAEILDAETLTDNIEVTTILPRLDRRAEDLEDIDIAAQDTLARVRMWAETYGTATEDEIPRMQAIFNQLTDALVIINNNTPQEVPAA